MRVRFACLLGVIAVAGCGPSAPPTSPRVPAAGVVGNNVITGKIYFDGTPPPPELVRNQPCCPGAPPTQLNETVVVNDNGTLANVFVYIENGPATDGSALPAALLDQQFCRYVPHAIGVVVNQPLTLRSSDPTVHNVNIRPENGHAINEHMTGAGETHTVRFDAPGFAPSKCDVHPWMTATIGVFDNPFFAVTGGQGDFTIRNVPDGTYTLIARHELYGPLRQTITLKDGRSVSADFRYHPPTP